MRYESTGLNTKLRDYDVEELEAPGKTAEFGSYVSSSFRNGKYIVENIRK